MLFPSTRQLIIWERFSLFRRFVLIVTLEWRDAQKPRKLHRMGYDASAAATGMYDTD